ncbi:hypothetical protein OO7_08750 [Providencia sneebia DSM 19967]|uniref:Uncharacterized protein n=1 Tax=Providencia sneebia DSM 19967 TaxID=1141660 RepID=K8W9Z5_9GAMM|nr:hypothetical protein OO7_08750 [Providencia sneebia DSM 19967]
MLHLGFCYKDIKCKTTVLFIAIGLAFTGIDILFLQQPQPLPDKMGFVSAYREPVTKPLYEYGDPVYCYFKKAILVRQILKAGLPLLVVMKNMRVGQKADILFSDVKIKCCGC